MVSVPRSNSSIKSQASQSQFIRSFFSLKPSQMSLLKDEIQNVKKTLDKDLAKTKKSNKIWNIINTGGWVTAMGTGLFVLSENAKNKTAREVFEKRAANSVKFLLDAVTVLTKLTGHEAAMAQELIENRGHRIP